MKVPLLLFSSIHHTSDYQCTLGKCTIPSFYSCKEGDFMRFHVILLSSLLSSFSLCKIVEKMLPSFSLFEKMLKYFFQGLGWAVRRSGGRRVDLGSTMAGDLLGSAMAGDLFFSRFGFQVTLGKWTIPSYYSCKKRKLLLLKHIS